MKTRANNRSDAHNQLAESVQAYLDARQDRRVTLTDLQEVFHVSGTQIKNTYKARFGESLYADTKARKMRAAAKALRETEDTVLEIAGRFGYDNASKFAAAFRSVMGVTPLRYRMGDEADAK